MQDSTQQREIFKFVNYNTNDEQLEASESSMSGTSLPLIDSNVFKVPKDVSLSKHQESNETISNAVSSNMANPSNSNNNKFVNIDSRSMYKFVNEIFENLDKKRARDDSFHSEFRESFREICDKFTKDHMEFLYAKYNQNSAVIEDKFKQIYEQLKVVTELEQEVKTISEKIETIYNEIKQNL